MSEVLVECRDVTVGYDRDAPILEHVDLRIERGEIVALLGGSGCGKSTILRALTGLLPPFAGEVILLGENLYALDLEARNRLLRRTGTAFQQDALFGSMTVEDNIGLAVRELTTAPAAVVREMVRMKLALVGLPGVERRFPTSLSGGQRKRIALARATITDPDVVFCDEPSAGLDPVIAAAIDKTLLDLRSLLGVTLVVVTHELESIRAIADRAVMFANGGIVAEGTVAQLEASRERTVHDFFHRVAAQPAHAAVAAR
jgi:phospholipid/cholesterol/gamma-HCH transport system ATP-binding protein